MLECDELQAQARRVNDRRAGGLGEKLCSLGQSYQELEGRFRVYLAMAREEANAATEREE